MSNLAHAVVFVLFCLAAALLSDGWHACLLIAIATLLDASSFKQGASVGLECMEKFAKIDSDN